jgi:predicted Zn-dependent protease
MIIAGGTEDIMKRGYDGFQHRSKRPGISIVFFGRIDRDLEDTLIHSLSQFSGSFGELLSVQPEFSCFHLPNPHKLPNANQETVFFPLLEQVKGNIVIGVTGSGFYDPSLHRYVFSYGSWNGRGLLSTYRFRTEIPNRGLFLDRLSKQIIKTLAMACGLGSCSNPECVVSYHRWVEDLDRNRYVCDACRSALIRSFSIFLKQYDNGDDFRGYA